MGAVAFSFATLRWGASTSTILPILTSLQRSCILARSAWSAPGREQRRLHFGQRNGFCHLSQAGSLRADWRKDGPPRWIWISRLRRDIRFQPLAGGAPELDIVVWKVNSDDRERASALAQSIFSNCAARNLHLALVQLPEPWFRSPDGAAAGAPWEAVKCLRSVLMKPEHEAWLDRIWEIIAASNVSEKEG